ncbi:MAG TPA: hypothetical protein VGV10_02970, partial [Thermoleophilaceae bacterium]|nr:hypothetical protein [Thermoleophilaceae bacterium]
MEDPATEPGATGRRWKVSVALVALGAIALAYGLIAQYAPGVYAGAALIVIFGCVAAGARSVEGGADPIHGKAEFDVTPPPDQAGR